jgi:glucokinase
VNHSHLPPVPKASRENRFVIGVDVGGTKVAAGLVDSQGTIHARSRVPMIALGKASEGLMAVTSAIDSLFAKNASLKDAICGIGICSPGPLDPSTGAVINPPNLPCWRNFPLAAEASKIYDVPVKVDNDANAAALAEVLWGAGRGYRNVFYTCIGTGIGGGFVLDGRIYHGRTGAAAEGGHVSIDYRGPRCRCGKPGCIEILASGPAIAKRAREKLIAQPGQRSAILTLANGNLELVTSEVVGQAYAQGDLLAKEVLQETIELLALWLSNIIDLLEPDAMVIGGGVGTILEPFLEEIRDRLPSFCVNSRAQEIPLLPARYGVDSGIAGGAALCWTSPRGAL